MTDPQSKIRDIDEIAAECRRWRSEGLTVVLVNGAFDVLHVGHIRYLAAARALGDRLVAAVNTDLSVRTSKGDLRPIIPEAERVEILSHLWMIDRICLFDSRTVAPVLETLQPEIHAKGTDYTVETVPERAVVEAYGGRTAICGDPKGPRHNRSHRHHSRALWRPTVTSHHDAKSRFSSEFGVRSSECRSISKLYKKSRSWIEIRNSEFRIPNLGSGRR